MLSLWCRQPPSSSTPAFLDLSKSLTPTEWKQLYKTSNFRIFLLIEKKKPINSNISVSFLQTLGRSHGKGAILLKSLYLHYCLGELASTCPRVWLVVGMVTLSPWHLHNSCLVSFHCCRNPSVVKSCEAKSPTQSHVSSRYWLTAWLLNRLGLSFGKSHHSALALVFCCVCTHSVMVCSVCHCTKWEQGDGRVCCGKGLFHRNSPLLRWARASQELIIQCSSGRGWQGAVRSRKEV